MFFHRCALDYQRFLLGHIVTITFSNDQIELIHESEVCWIEGFYNENHQTGYNFSSASSYILW